MRVSRGFFAFVISASATAHATPKAGAPAPAPAPKRLLDAPVLQTHARGVASFGDGADVRVTWIAIPGAARYHSLWTDSSGKVADTWSTATSFHREKLLPGTYTLTVSAMDAAGTEGALTPPLAIEVVDVAAVPPGKVASEPPTRGAYPVGTVFSTAGAPCTLGGGSPSERVKGDPNKARATHPGLTELRCADKLATTVIIAPVVVASKEQPLPRGETTDVHVIVASAGAIGEQLTVQGIGGAKAGEGKRTPFGLDVPLAIAADAQAAAVAVSGGGIELGRTGFELTDPAAPPPPPPPSPGSAAGAVDLAFAAGAFLPTADKTDMNAPDIGRPKASRDVVGSGALFGPRVGLYLLPRVGFEVEGDILTLPVNDTRVAAFGARGQIAVRALESQWVGARAILGAGAIRTLADAGTARQATTGELHYGLGVTLNTTAGVSLRGDVLDVMSTSRDGGYAHNLELELAVVARFGRRDRW